MGKKKLFICVLFCLLLVFSCRQNVSLNKGADVFLYVVSNTDRSIVDNVNLNPARYQYSVSRGADSISYIDWKDVSAYQQQNSEKIKIENVEYGDWIFSVRAFNSTGDLISQGSVNVNVSEKSENIFEIVLARVNSDITGRFDLSIEVPLYGDKVPMVSVMYRRLTEDKFEIISDFGAGGPVDYEKKTVLIKGNMENLPEGSYQITLTCICDGKHVGGSCIITNIVGNRTTYITGSIDGMKSKNTTEITFTLEDILPFLWDEPKPIVIFYDEKKGRAFPLDGGSRYTVSCYIDDISQVRSLKDLGISPIYRSLADDMSKSTFMIIGSKVTGLTSSLDKGWFGNSYMPSGINENLRELYVNQNITEGALMQLRALNKLVLGPSAEFTTIDSNILPGSTLLRSIIIPPNIKNIGEEAFAQSGIKTVYCRINSNQEPSGWESGWDRGVSSIVWNYEGD